MRRSEFEELSAGHALHALDPSDEHLFQGELVSHPEWGDIARRDEDTVTALLAQIDPVTPPEGLRASLLSRLRHDASTADTDELTDAEQGTDADEHTDADDVLLPELVGATPGGAGPLPTEVVQTVARRSWTRGILTLAASLVVLTVLGFGSAWVGGNLFPHSVESVALEQIERAPDGQRDTMAVQGGGEVTAYWSESLGQAVLVTDGVATLEPTETYELWLVRGGSTLASGIFDVDADGAATTVLDGVVERGDSIAITVEPAGGSLDGTPSSDPVVVIPTGTV